MVKSCKIITTTKGKQIKLWQNLNCKNYGIYVAQCEICQKQYVGQTKNTFSTRWNTHRAVWKKFDLSDNNDKSALLRHYANCHTQNFNTKPTISDCFSVIFVEEPKLSHLDWCEDKWYNKLEADININKLLLPRFKLLFLLFLPFATVLCQVCFAPCVLRHYVMFLLHTSIHPLSVSFQSAFFSR